MRSLKEELRRVRGRYAAVARWYGSVSPEAKFLEAERHRLEDLEPKLNETETIFERSKVSERLGF